MARKKYTGKKSISWVQPGSSTSEKLGHYDRGCWIVEICEDGSRSLMGEFESFKNAKFFADKMEESYSEESPTK